MNDQHVGLSYIQGLYTLPNCYFSSCLLLFIHNNLSINIRILYDRSSRSRKFQQVTIALFEHDVCMHSRYLSNSQRKSCSVKVSSSISLTHKSHSTTACAPWNYADKSTGQCKCIYLKNRIKCNDEGTLLRNGYCTTFKEGEGLYLVRCPYFSGV